MRFSARRCFAFLLLLSSVGCAGAGVRQVQVEPLGRYTDQKKVSVTVTGEAPDALKSDLGTAFANSLAASSGFEVSTTPDLHALTVELHIVDALVPRERPLVIGGSSATPPSVLTVQANKFANMGRGIAGRYGLGPLGSGRLTLEARLVAPDSDETIGFMRYDRRGDAVALLEPAAQSAGQRFGRELRYQDGRYVRRRAADERLFLTPTPLTLERGEWVVSDDELLLFRVGVGLHRRIQLDTWFGGLPVWGPLGAGGGAAFVGMLDVGLKVAILEESKYVPGLAVSYDFLNTFGVGAVAMAFPGGAVAAGTAGNAQFNIFAVSTSKHFHNTHITLGSYFIDNHHFVPQGAVFASNGGVGSKGIKRVPLQVQPFLGVEQVLGAHTSLALEVMPRLPVKHTLGTFGARWLLGGNVPRGPVALDRLRFRIDAAAVVAKSPLSAHAMIIPWLGIGLYVARKK